MRNALIPICYHNNMEFSRRITYLQSKITHQGDEAAVCCELLTFIIFKILNENNLKEILYNLGKDFKCECESINYLTNSSIRK
jgi:ADP-ribosylglycohydrolase